MASISSDPNGRKRIQFFGRDGKRNTIRLGKMALKDAETVKLYIENLVSCTRSSQSPRAATADWVGGLPEAMRRTLEKAGLIQPQQHEKEADGMTLGAFLDAYAATRTSVKARTLEIWKTTRRDLVAFFGENKPIAEIKPGDADDWAEYMKGQYAPATSGRRAGFAKQFFRWGARKELLPRNPFDGISTRCPENKDRTVFVTREMAEKVLAACPDAQWRVIFALCRYAGLRCPSELTQLRWGDVDWEHNRMLVRSPKTERYSGKESRLVPIFPELQPHLLEAYTLAEEGSEFVVTRCRDDSQNLRKRLAWIITKAGMQPWPKTFINLRSSCQTELTERFPVHVVCAWLGNSALIANRHYLQVTDGHWNQAAQGGAKSGAVRSARNRNDRHGVPVEKSESSNSLGKDTEINSPKLSVTSCNPDYYTRQDSNL